MKITPVHSRENKPEYKMPFVPAFVVEGAKLVFVAGCGPIPPYHKHPHVPEEEAEWMRGGIREQTRKTFEHIKEVLGAAGADLTNVVKLTIFLRDVGRSERRERDFRRDVRHREAAATNGRSGRGAQP